MMIKYAGLSTMSIVDEVFVSAWEWLIILYFWESTTDIWCGFTLPMRTAGVQRWTGRNVLTFANSTAIYVKKNFQNMLCSVMFFVWGAELSIIGVNWIRLCITDSGSALICKRNAHVCMSCAARSKARLSCGSDLQL